MLASSSSRSGSLGRHGFMASRKSVIGTSSKEKRKRRATKKDKKPPPPSTDEIQAMLMRDFAEGVMYFLVLEYSSLFVVLLDTSGNSSLY